MLFLSLCLMLNVMNTYGSYLLHNCHDYSNKNNCISEWNCMWCNNSVIENNTIVQKTSCNIASPCFIDQENNKNCIYDYSNKYELRCKIGRILTYILLLVGFYISIVVIYGTLNKVILRDVVVTPNIKKSFNTMIFILTTTPIVVSFFTSQLVFNFLLVSYIISASLIYCCIKVDMSKGKGAYTSIN